MSLWDYWSLNHKVQGKEEEHMNHNNIIAKEAIVNEVYELANDNAAVIVFEYHGLSVAKITELRRLLRAEGSTMAIYKNSLVERAAENLVNKN